MNKRLLDYSASDFLKAKPMELKQAILASEGRTIMAENVPSSCPYMGKSVTNAELERAAGADLILFNALDLFNPQISGVPLTLKENPIIWIKKALGRAIGVNLEPVDKEVLMSENRTEISSGRIVSPETLKKANELGFNFICLTGNPGTGVSNRTI
ncbi:TPA: haloacid dehalogenase-like hydrolase, partial [Enterococcus faecium]